MVRALIAGLEHTYQSRGPGGMASTMMVLEIMHTHYWEREGSSKSDTTNQSLVRSFFAVFCFFHTLIGTATLFYKDNDISSQSVLHIWFNATVREFSLPVAITLA